MSGATRAERPAGEGDTLPMFGLLVLIALTLTWGASFPAMKIVLGEMPVWTFRAVCLVFGAAGLAAIAVARGYSLAVPRRHWGWMGVCALFNVVGWHMFSGYALTVLPAGRAVIIGYTMPLWVVLLAAPLLGERITTGKLAGLALGLAGLAVLIGPAWAELAAVPSGMVLMVLAALSWAIGTVLIKMADWTIPTTVLTAWQLGLSAIPITIGALLIDDLDWSLGAYEWAALVYVLLGAMLFSHWAWFTVVRLLPSSIAAISTLMIPVIGVIVGALVLGERVAWQDIAALACVCAGLATVLVPPALKARRDRRLAE